MVVAGQIQAGAGGVERADGHGGRASSALEARGAGSGGIAPDVSRSNGEERGSGCGGVLGDGGPVMIDDGRGDIDGAEPLGSMAAPETRPGWVLRRRGGGGWDGRGSGDGNVGDGRLRWRRAEGRRQREGRTRRSTEDEKKKGQDETSAKRRGAMTGDDADGRGVAVSAGPRRHGGQ